MQCGSAGVQTNLSVSALASSRLRWSCVNGSMGTEYWIADIIEDIQLGFSRSRSGFLDLGLDGDDADHHLPADADIIEAHGAVR